MSRIVAEPPAGANYPRVVFDHDEAADTVTLTIGEKQLPALTTTELAALVTATTQLVQHDRTEGAQGPRAEEPGPAVPAGERDGLPRV